MTSREDPLIQHPTGFTPAVKGVLIFTFLELGAAGTWAVSRGNGEYLLFLATLIPAIALLGLMHRRIRFSAALLGCLSFLLFLHITGGLLELPRGFQTDGQRVLYNWWLLKPHLKYDHFVHAVGSGTATWFCWQLMQRAVASRTGWAFRDLRPTGELLFFCILSGIGLGALNEVLEFYATRIVPDTNVGGYVNNAVDLVANAVGSLGAAAAIWVYYRVKR